MKRKIIFDMETDGLYWDVTRFWVVSYMDLATKEIKSLVTEEEVRELFSCTKTLFIGHNILKYDFPVLNKLFGINPKRENIYDTLALSQALFPEKRKHGLAELGNKVEVEDDEWLEGDASLMVERCEGDVRDNYEVYMALERVLDALYNKQDKGRFINYIMFKTDCIKEQEFYGGIGLDLDLINTEIGRLEPMYNEKINALERELPPVKKFKKIKSPKQKFKKDGSYTKRYEEWINLLRDNGIEEDFEGEIEILDREVPPNAGSVQQIKDWLFSLGWEPIHFKYSRNVDGGINKVPQIKSEDDPEEICPSIKKLQSKAPEAIDALNSLTIIKHRLDIYRNFLKHNNDGLIYPTALGFTNTLRKKHRVLVNLPSSHAPFAENIRKSLIAKGGMVLVGSDLAGIEDNTKRHFIYKYDPEYVKEQMSEGFDAHMDIAKLADLISDEEIELWKGLRELDDAHQLNLEGKKVFAKLDGIRDIAKTVNFSSLYGVGAVTMSRSTGMSEERCQKLIDTYWMRNWAVNKFAQNCTTKKIKFINAKGEKEDAEYIQNPINGYWYFLKAEKDRFSTVNQSSGQYILDIYIMLVRERYQVLFQYHDELLIMVNKGEEEEAIQFLKDCIAKVNEILKLNIEVKASYKYGDNYAEV